MILVRIDAEFVLVPATQTLTTRKPRTGVRARGYAEPIIPRSPATLGHAAAHTVRVLAAVRHLCGGISNERPCRDPGIVSVAGFVEPTIGVTLSTPGCPSTDHDTRLADDDCPLSRVAPNWTREVTRRANDLLRLMIQVRLPVFSSVQRVTWRLHLTRLCEQRCVLGIRWIVNDMPANAVAPRPGDSVLCYSPGPWRLSPSGSLPSLERENPAGPSGSPCQSRPIRCRAGRSRRNLPS